jgi:hypothetical protein
VLGDLAQRQPALHRRAAPAQREPGRRLGRCAPPELGGHPRRQAAQVHRHVHQRGVDLRQVELTQRLPGSGQVRLGDGVLDQPDVVAR